MGRDGAVPAGRKALGTEASLVLDRWTQVGSQTSRLLEMPLRFVGVPRGQSREMHAEACMIAGLGALDESLDFECVQNRR